jgi:DNA modification methylase
MNIINTIYLGDSLKLIDELELNPGLTIMSPPDMSSTNFSLEEYKIFINTIYKKCWNKTNGTLVSITTDRKINRKVYCKHIDIINSIGLDPNFYKIWCKSLKCNFFILNYCHILVWQKNNSISKQIKEWLPDVFNMKVDRIKKYPMKDSFPSELIEIIINKFTEEGDLVLDPFFGSGKTGLICNKLKRNWIGFEIDKKYIDIANIIINDK